MFTGHRLQLSLWLRVGGVFALVGLFLVHSPVLSARAYGGGGTLHFHGGMGSSEPPLLVDGVDIPYRHMLGTTADCLTTKSITAWVRPTGTPAASYDIMSLETIAADRQVFFGISRGVLRVVNQPQLDHDALWVYTVPNSGTSDYKIPIPYTPGQWVHVAYVQGNGTLTAYRNGVFVGQITAPPTAEVFFTGFNCGLLVIGQPFEPSVPTLQGEIDEVGFWSTALTPAEIHRSMNRELAGNEPGLEAYYRLNEGSGTTVADSTGHGWTGLITASPTWVTSGALSGPRNALSFDGSTQSVSVADPGAGSLLDITSGALTFEAWVNAANWNNGVLTPFAVKGDGASPQVNYYLGKSAANRLVFRFYNGSWVTAEDSSAATFADNTWYHLATVVDFTAHTASFYRNGALLSTVSFGSASVLSNNQPLTLASLPNSSPAQYFQGKLDEVRLWNTARTGVQIVDNMFQTLKGDESGLVAYYRFDQYNPAESTLYDTTFHNLDGSLQGMALSVPWTPSNAFNTWIGAESTSWASGGNWSQYQAPGLADNVGIFSYAGGNDATLSTSAEVGNLVAATGSNLWVNSSGSLTVSGALRNNGSLTAVKDVSGSVDVSFFDTGGYGGLLINPNGDNLGSTAVSIRGNRDCSEVPGDTVQRCFEITPASNNTAIGKRLTFSYSTAELSGNLCSQMGAFHREGGVWAALTLDPAYGTGGRLCSSDPLSLRAINVTSFSPFMLNQDTHVAIPRLIFLPVLAAD